MSQKEIILYDRLRYLANKEGDKYERARNLFARVRQRWTYQQKVLLVDLIRVHGLDYGKLAEGLIMEPSVVEEYIGKRIADKDLSIVGAVQSYEDPYQRALFSSLSMMHKNQDILEDEAKRQHEYALKVLEFEDKKQKEDKQRVDEHIAVSQQRVDEHIKTAQKQRVDFVESENLKRVHQAREQHTERLAMMTTAAQIVKSASKRAMYSDGDRPAKVPKLDIVDVTTPKLTSQSTQSPVIVDSTPIRKLDFNSPTTSSPAISDQRVMDLELKLAGHEQENNLLRQQYLQFQQQQQEYHAKEEQWKKEKDTWSSQFATMQKQLLELQQAAHHSSQQSNSLPQQTPQSQQQHQPAPSPQITPQPQQQAGLFPTIPPSQPPPNNIFASPPTITQQSPFVFPPQPASQPPSQPPPQPLPPPQPTASPAPQQFIFPTSFPSASAASAQPHNQPPPFTFAGGAPVFSVGSSDSPKSARRPGSRRRGGG